MYCKSKFITFGQIIYVVLIVAKCIVNGINSETNGAISCVLIVAKCIVNRVQADIKNPIKLVLIVAKCIVNLKVQNVWNKGWGINSSKI